MIIPFQRRYSRSWRPAILLVVIVSLLVACRPAKTPKTQTPAATQSPGQVTRLPAALTPTESGSSPTTPLPSPTRLLPVTPTQVPTGAAPSPADSAACTALGTTWTGGQASLRLDGETYDVSGCERPARPTEFEIVEPAQRDPARWETARCNDGSPFSMAVALSPDKQNQEWVIYLEGGGFCDDASASCRERPGPLTRAPNARDGVLVAVNQSGIFNRDATLNPTFHAANYVFARYCSSDLWSGVSAEPRPTDASPTGWYFSGRLNVQAMLDILQQRYGLDDSNLQTRVLFAGSSAGGVGMQGNADLMVNALPQTAQAGRLRLLNDAGFIPDLANTEFAVSSTGFSLPAVLTEAYDFWGSALPPLCEQAQRNRQQPPGRCFVGSVAYPYIVAPPPGGLGVRMLVQISLADAYFLDLNSIDSANNAVVNRWRDQIRQSIDSISDVFASRRIYHTLLTEESRWDYPAESNGATFREVLDEFWRSGPGG